MRLRAAKYRRISSDREGRELGIDRQDEQLDDLAERLDLVIVGDYVDNDIGASAKSRKPRPDYNRLLADARAGKFEYILAATTGRLTRRPREHEDLIDLAVQHGTRFAYSRSPSFDLNTAQGRRVARTLAAQDAGESEEIAERVVDAARQRAMRGGNHGGRRCFGYTKDGLHLEPAEAAEVERLADELLRGTPLAALAKDLNSRGVKTTSGGQFTPTTVRDLMRIPRLAGLRVYRGEVVGEGNWPAILGVEQHHALVALLTDPARRTTTGNRAAYLLSGLARCAACGGSITSFGIKTSRDGKKRLSTPRHLYRCRSGACVARRRDWVDTYVSQSIFDRLRQPDAVELLVDRSRPDSTALQDEAHALRVQLDEAAALFARRRIDSRQLDIITKGVNERLAEIHEIRQHVSRAPILRDLVEAGERIEEVWEGMTLDRQRAVVQCLIEVKLHPGGGGRRTFDPTKVQINWI
ncbi:recombinase family protein [Polymorphospora rubra]|uniref:Serine recombinase n=1 Tax=Polymorphospora rubra TaxID=338584 RepID=A0A810MVU9_9ACTN|nr:recombinase family protein [Polymorphospora rubra]BCJ65142.1 serine recombinase [Polymorphospora rubra]